jgi:hypothetical protein
LHLFNTGKTTKEGSHVLAKLVFSTIILLKGGDLFTTPCPLFYGCGGGASGKRLKRALKCRQGLFYGGEPLRSLARMIFLALTTTGNWFTESRLHPLDFRSKHA